MLLCLQFIFNAMMANTHSKVFLPLSAINWNVEKRQLAALCHNRELEMANFYFIYQRFNLFWSSFLLQLEFSNSEEHNLSAIDAANADDYKLK